MLIYSQSTGMLWNDAGELLERGYSGHGKGKNNPDLQSTRNVGPIPRGIWNIGQPYDSENVGRFALPLNPSGQMELFGRSDFLIHGDSIKAPGTASHGCIIVSRPTRELIHKNNDRILKVIF